MCPRCWEDPPFSAHAPRTAPTPPLAPEPLERCTTAYRPAVQPGSGAFPVGPVLIQVCAWCESIMGTLATQNPRTALTYGICTACARRLAEQAIPT